MPNNADLNQAKAAKNDEFYTQLSDIEKEMVHYKKYFKDKVIYCNCDDPRASQFFHYFSFGFEMLGLKKLISSCYKNQSVDLFSKEESEKGISLEYNGDLNGNGVPDPEEIGIKQLKGDGDFRSEESIELLKQADIIVTNPPFSLFREYVEQLMEHKKKFIILGNLTAVTTKNIFPYVQSNQIWLGHSIHSGDREFGVPNNSPFTSPSERFDKDGNKFVRVKGVRWYTNLDYRERHEDLPLYKTYAGNKADYPKYDNYDAINVNKIKDIPKDYTGIIGVPVSFIDKYSPEQFEILGCTQRGCHEKVPDTRKYNNYKEMRPDGTPTGSSGNKTNENANLLKNDGKKNYFTDGKRIIQACYGRIFIRNRNPERNN